jgi:hypothetical protein
MNTVHAFLYKGNEIIILFDQNEELYAVDIRIDDYDGHMIQGYCGLGSESEAISVGKAFVDGLRHVEESGIQNR